MTLFLPLNSHPECPLVHARISDRRCPCKLFPSPGSVDRFSLSRGALRHMANTYRTGMEIYELTRLIFAGVKGIGGNANGRNVSKLDGSDAASNKALTLEIQPSGHVILGRKGITLNCITGSNENILWLHNGMSAPPCGLTRCVLLPNGSLHFYKVHASVTFPSSLSLSCDNRKHCMKANCTNIARRSKIYKCKSSKKRKGMVSLMLEMMIIRMNIAV